MQLLAVAAPETVYYMMELWEADRLRDSAATYRTYSTCPLGTIHYLSRLQELVTAFRDCRGTFRYKSTDDKRLKYVQQVLAEFRTTAQYLSDLWNDPGRDPKTWLKTPVSNVRKLFIAAETMSALDCCIQSFVGTLALYP